MSTALHAFLHGLVDYAGLFPPTKLEMQPAIRNYFSYRQSPAAWMLGKFVCPASRLQEMADAASSDLDSKAPLGVSALVRPAESAAEFLQGLESDLEEIQKIHRAYSREIRVESLETRLPASLSAERDLAESFELFLRSARERMADAGLRELPAFHEIVPGAAAERVMEAAACAIGDVREADESPEGLKLRCGGVMADAFPNPALVATAIHSARDHRVPLKFTAGLHHPLRHADKALKTKVHGFLNVFGAALLAGAHGLDRKAIVDILEDEEAGNFTFTLDAFAWKRLSVKSREIESLRESVCTSFGSCSFDEPGEDLRRLGLLDDAAAGKRAP